MTSPAGVRDVEVALRPDASVADLAAALGATGPVAVDGRLVTGVSAAVEAGIRDGCRVALDGPPGFLPEEDVPAYEVVVTAGPDAGQRWALDGVLLVGRGPRAQLVLTDPTVSTEHCTLERVAGGLRVAVAGARNAVAVDDRVLPAGGATVGGLDAAVRLGRTELLVRARPADAAVTGPGGFNRPPRPATPELPSPPVLPAAPVAQRPEPFSTAALVGPLVLAAVMVAVTGDPRFAMFSALSPLLAVGTWWEGRRRSHRADRAERARYAAGLADLGHALAAAARQERDRLRAVLPDPAEVLRRAALPSTRLWERREGAGDLLLLSCGTADQPLATARAGPATAPEVAELLAGARLLAAPVPVDLSAGGVLGLVGDRGATLATARSLLCAAAVAAGPADLAVAVCVAPGREPDWSWSGWLPHAAGRLAAGRDRSDALLRRLDGAGPRLLVLLDDATLTTGSDAPARDLLGRPDVSGLVVAASAESLPASCDHVLLCAADGTAVLVRPGDGTRLPGVLLAGLSPATARRCAYDLSRVVDPELRRDGTGLPADVRLLPLLGVEGTDGTVDPEAVRSRWRAGGPDPGLRTPLGVGEDGTFVLDLVRDGAHGLVGGTTGSGKSELLRSLVAGLAVHADPEHLTFVLVDYKGGAAFDVCSRLPHVVGLVTDLDEQLGERALRALGAELHHRERTLRAAGVADLRDYLALGRPQPLPRLVVVIDEFATLAKELPDFLAALVGIAQRGRTLGVHLLLATQRPSGVVDDNIRANTNLRVALRVQDAADSTDVIGGPLAARIGRDRPGRAYVRLGPGEVVPIQTALVTATGPPAADRVRVRPLGFAGPGEVVVAGAPGPSDLERLVDAVVAAAAGRPAPRRPWPEPLPPVLPLEGLLGEDPPGTAVVALADDPATQSQHRTGWDLDEGGLLLLGVPGSGTTTGLVSLALSLAASAGPDRLEVYGIDFGVGDLRVLEQLPHTGAVLPAGDRERQARLLRRLGTELARRRALPTGALWPRTVLLVDNLPGMRAAYDDVPGLELLDLLARLHADGPEVGIAVALTADRPAGVPGALAAVTAQKWLFRFADPFDHASLGVTRGDVPAALPGRAVLLPSRLQAQLGLPGPDLAGQVAARWRGTAMSARPVGALPARLGSRELGPAGVTRDPWRLPVGRAEADLEIAHLELYEGEGALLAGPARSGRTGVLIALAEGLAAAGVQVVGTGGRRSALSGSAAVARWLAPAELAGAVPALGRPGEGAPSGGQPTVLLVDDAERVDDAEGALARLVADPGPRLRIVAAGRSDALRTAYGHWTAGLRRSRTGLLLCPQVDLDGDLLGVTLPRRAAVPLSTARGYLVVSGQVALVQCATG